MPFLFGVRQAIRWLAVGPPSWMAPRDFCAVVRPKRILGDAVVQNLGRDRAAAIHIRFGLSFCILRSKRAVDLDNFIQRERPRKPLSDSHRSPSPSPISPAFILCPKTLSACVSLGGRPDSRCNCAAPVACAISPRKQGPAMTAFRRPFYDASRRRHRWPCWCARVSITRCPSHGGFHGDLVASRGLSGSRPTIITSDACVEWPPNPLAKAEIRLLALTLHLANAVHRIFNRSSERVILCLRCRSVLAYPDQH